MRMNIAASSKSPLGTAKTRLRRAKQLLTEELTKSIESQEVLARLIDRADVVMTNVLPGRLAKFGLDATAVQRPLSTLSPGERTRALLALFQAQGVNLLILDEPSNHLDLPALEQLEQALESYDGTLVLVSHDRALLASMRITRTIELG